jgi:hypothetical protein
LVSGVSMPIRHTVAEVPEDSLTLTVSPSTTLVIRPV